MSRQKQKGNAFERVTAEHLTKVFDLKFFRTPGSGAYVGGSNFHRAYDMTNLKFECKTLKKFSFSSLYHKNATLDSWLEQAHSDDKLWFLVFKINNRGSFVAYDSEKYQPLVVPPESNYMQYKSITITRLDGFFEINKQSLLAFCNQ